MNKLAKDPKAKLLETFQQVLSERQRILSRVETKEEEAEKIKDREILATTSTYTVDTIVKGLADLQLDFGGIITGISDKLTSELGKLEALKRAIEVETERQQELRQIRVVADAVYILAQEHQEAMHSVEQSAEERLERLTKDQAEKHKIWQKEQQEFEILVQEQAIVIERERQQQEADFNYEIGRKCQIEQDEYEEARRDQERQIQESNQLFGKDWTEREQTLTRNQPLLVTYLQQIEAFPIELDQAVKKARAEAIEEVNRETKVKADLFEKEWEGSKQGYELKVQSLEQSIQRQVEQIADLTAQLQAAMRQAQELAMRAFANSASLGSPQPKAAS